MSNYWCQQNNYNGKVFIDSIFAVRKILIFKHFKICNHINGLISHNLTESFIKLKISAVYLYLKDYADIIILDSFVSFEMYLKTQIP